MSSDGQVSIFSLDDPFAAGQRYTLQTVASLPHLSPWLTPVGQAYQVSAHASTVRARTNSQGATDNSAILFRYLARDVPAGYEDGLHIYYSPDAGATWQRLATQLDTHSNQASAALQGDGFYLLAATVEVQPAFTTGWNVFGYPVQQSQPASTALASIAGSYTVAYAYDAAAQQWSLYAPTVPAPFSDLVNTLHQLDYAHSYWVYATQPVTLYVGVGSTSPGVVSSNAEGATGGNSPLAPAIYYGWVTAIDSFTPAVGMRVRAEIDGVTCGETTIQAVGGQLVYVLPVPASDPSVAASTCGATGKEITFKVGDQTMAQHHAWDNRQAWFQPLGGNPPAGNTLYLPLIRR